ncbi:MFS transporter [Candidatus Methylocalor cossyra]|uniref:MFS transporter n=1 Tax=Candidatus Methylocalor cossyra TaxID=3108543 RepID=UPI0032B20B02
MTLGSLAIGMVKGATPLFALALGASKGQIGLITGAQPLILAVVSLPVGLAVGRYGPRALFVVGSFAAAAVHALAAGTDSPWWLLAATAAASLFMPMRFVSTQSEFFHYLVNTGGQKAGWLRGAQLAGAFVLGPMLGGYLVTWVGFERTYWIIASVFLLPVVLAPGVLSGRCEARRRRAAEESGPFWRQLVQVFSHPEIIETSLIDLAAHAALMFYTVFVVVLALEQFHASREAATGLIAIQGISFMVALFLLDGLWAGLGRARFYGFSFSSAALGLLFLGTGWELSHLQLGGAFLGVGLGMLGIANMIRLAAVSEKLGRGTVAGASALSGPLGGLLGTLGGGLASQWIPMQHIFLGLMTAMMIIALFTLYREQRFPAVPRQAIGFLSSAARGVLGLALYGLFPATLLVLWQLSAHYGWTSPQILPPPAVVWATLEDLLVSGEIATNLGISLWRVLQGFALGSGIGLALGFAMGLSRTVEAYLGPTFKALASVPMLGWVPLFIVLLGIDEALKVAIIAVGCVVPVTLNTLEGVRAVPKGYVEVARVLRFSRWQLLRQVIVPAAVPPIFSGISLSLSHAWKAMVAIELMASSEGIGFLMVMGRQLFQLDVVLATILVIGVIGLILDQGLRLAERYLTRWRPAAVR